MRGGKRGWRMRSFERGYSEIWVGDEMWRCEEFNGWMDGWLLQLISGAKGDGFYNNRRLNYGGYTTTVHTEFAFRIFINTGTVRQDDRHATHIMQYNNTTKIGKNLYKYNYYMHHHHN